jgi:CheY-like chemotaxis protein
MVVEDEPDIYEVLLAMFEMWGIEGVAFVDGEEAVAWIDDVDNRRFQGELPELALLDIRLPGDIDGAGVGERLRKSPVLGRIAIVLTTAFRLKPDEEESIVTRSGADKLIYKPLPKFNQLQRLLEEVIAQRRVKAAQQVPAQSIRARAIVPQPEMRPEPKPKPKLEAEPNKAETKSQDKPGNA